MSALARFSEPTQAWFAGAFEEPTPAQEQGWEAISRGDHTLILAPTGSGKTLAAFLWTLDRLLTTDLNAEPAKGARILYVSPLKALTYDVERNLRAPLAGIALEAERRGASLPTVRVATRTGDTPQSDRRDMAKRPPDILITTPESLYLLLTSGAREILRTVEHVIVDEIHAMAATKRGAHLALSLERLERLTVQRAPASPPQRIGLSATQRPLDEIARFLGGRVRDGSATGGWRTRPVTVVDAGVRKALELQVVVPVEDMSELGRPVDTGDLSGPAAGNPQRSARWRTEGEPSGRPGPPWPERGPEVRHSIWPAIYPRLLELIESHRSTLIFVNSRRLAERLAARLNELAWDRSEETKGSPNGSPEANPLGEPGLRGPNGNGSRPVELVRAHHGSVAREQRLEIEDALKAGKLPALVATSSLELGIDMGAIDLVIQVESPTSVASGLQRIGRAGHQVGQPSRGRIFPKFRGDLVEAAVVVQRMKAGLIEETRVPRNPLDVLAQQIVAMCAVEDLTVDEVFDVALAAYPFADCSRSVFEAVLDMLSGRYPSDDFAELKPRLTWDRVDGSLRARPGARMLAVTSGGTIPDRGLYGVFTPEGTRVGELDEEMVYESRPGETFVLGATTWRIEDITRDRVVVTPAPGEPGKMPFWHGDGVGRPYELGRAIGAFLRGVDGISDEQLGEECALDPLAIRNLRAYVDEERSITGALPTDREVVVERFRDELGDWRLCVLTPFGGRVHAPWALAIEAKIQERLGLEVQTMWSDEGIVVRLPEADESPPVEHVLIEPEEVEDLVVGQVSNSALFASRFRENAARALLLPRRRPGSRTPLWQQRQRAADLQVVASRYGSFPIVLETYRECLRDNFDLPALTELLTDIRSRKVRVVAVDTVRPSPFASSLAFAYVANFLYEGDAPLAERRAQALTLDREMLAELLGDEELRELIDPLALASLEAELQALDDHRRATHVDAAHDLLRRLGDLTPDGLRARATADFAEELVATRRALQVRVAAEVRLIAAEDAGRYRDALGVALPPGVPEAFLEPVDDPLGSLLGRWARTHVPFTTPDIAAHFGLPTAMIDEVLLRRVDAGRLLRGAFRPDSSEREWSDPDVLRALRQRSLAALRKQVEPVDAAALARFLPAWQGVGQRRERSSARAGARAAPAAGSDRRGLDRLFEVVSQLQGVPIPSSVLERDVLSARVADYSPRLLDELAAAGEVVWVGAGPLGRDDGKVMLFLRGHASRLRPLTPPGERPGGEEHEQLRGVLSQRGACFFRELTGDPKGASETSASAASRASVAGTGHADSRSLDALWDLVWAGEVTNDSFAPLRALHARKSRPSSSRRARPNLGSLTALGPPRAQGRWSLVEAELPVDEVSPTERTHALAAAVLDRHGVLTRESVRGEGHPGGFAAVYPVLKAMEERGRIRRGYFVAGLGGAQFALPGAVDRLRAARDGTGAALVLAATDPANPYGVALPWPVKGPQRAAGAYVVLLDGVPSVYLEKGGRSAVSLREHDGTWERDAVDALLVLVEDGRLRRLALDRFDDALAPALREAGFVPSPRGLVRYA